jgi:2-phospho-L-lactate transferase/gluconeogenesis factor (CofD/UPF0052 family)
MNRNGQTTNYKVSDYLREIEKYTGKDIFDYILVNNQRPSKELIEEYKDEGELVPNDLKGDPRVVEAPLLGEKNSEQKGDLLKRSLIRHDSKNLAYELMKIIVKTEGWGIMPEVQHLQASYKEERAWQ